MIAPPETGLSTDFKLKWLSQSRDAPPDATRCRTCALAASKGSKNNFCPLAIVSDLASEREEAIKGMANSLANRWNAEQSRKDYVESRLRRFFEPGNPGRDLVSRLREWQDGWDSNGVATDDVDPKLNLAMTLRDCTMFLTVPNQSDLDIEARLGDLDIKTAGKVPEWRTKENALLQGGWYYGDPSDPSEVCVLCRRRPA
jgi:inositol-pentakisphosphate 2-kinase